jgi:metal-responsive CopG/Arc/MetJ family transcriptional regulator
MGRGIHIYFPTKTLKQLEKTAKAEGVSKSEIIRRALEMYVRDNERK